MSGSPKQSYLDHRPTHPEAKHSSTSQGQKHISKTRADTVQSRSGDELLVKVDAKLLMC